MMLAKLSEQQLEILRFLVVRPQSNAAIVAHLDDGRGADTLRASVSRAIKGLRERGLIERVNPTDGSGELTWIIINDLRLTLWQEFLDFIGGEPQQNQQTAAAEGRTSTIGAGDIEVTIKWRGRTFTPAEPSPKPKPEPQDHRNRSHVHMVSIPVRPADLSTAVVSGRPIAPTAPLGHDDRRTRLSGTRLLRHSGLI